MFLMLLRQGLERVQSPTAPGLVRNSACEAITRKASIIWLSRKTLAVRCRSNEPHHAVCVFQLVDALAELYTLALRVTAVRKGLPRVSDEKFCGTFRNYSCDLAKKAATAKAANMGFKGRVVWDKLSNDNDCKVSTASVGHAGAGNAPVDVELGKEALPALSR